MDKELIKELLEYIEESEEATDSEWGSARSSKEIIKNGDMPEVYYKLLKLR